MDDRLSSVRDLLLRHTSMAGIDEDEPPEHDTARGLQDVVGILVEERLRGRMPADELYRLPLYG